MLQQKVDIKQMKKTQMKFFRQLFLAVFTLTNTLSFGQIPKYLFNEVTEETYDTKDFISKTKLIKERTGIYHFGESEGEWDFVILQNSDSLIVQIFYGIWGKNYLSKEETWLTRCKTFNKVTVRGNKIFFGKYSGLFANYTYENKTTNALLLFCDPILEKNYGKDSAEVGHYNYLSSIDNFYRISSDNDYYKLSTEVQQEDYFKDKTKQELQIMRNTIYAKYGLIFQAGGEMEKYFRKKSWYNPFLKNVSNCLTNIEKQNIQTITRLERL
jgi:hypothetical protein